MSAGLFVADRWGNISLVEGRELDREGGEVGEMGENGEGIISLTLSAVDNGSPIQLTQTSVSHTPTTCAKHYSSNTKNCILLSISLFPTLNSHTP